MEKRHRYILLSNNTGERLELEQAPVGFDATKFNLLRDLVYLGILKKISVEFSFVGDGFEFCQRHRLLFGIDADIRIRRYKNNPNEFEFEGKLNQENYNEDRKLNKYSCDIIQSSFVQKFSNREDVKLNVLNNISLDRLPVVPAGLKNATIRGKQIEFYSEFDGSAVQEPDVFHHTPPFLLKVNGNPGVKGVYELSANTWIPDTLVVEDCENNPMITSDAAFYVNVLGQTQTLQLKFKINFTATYLGAIELGSTDTETNHIVYRMLKVNDDNSVDEQLFFENISHREGSVTLEYNFNQSVSVAAGQYLVLLCERWGQPLPIGVTRPLDVTEMDTSLKTEIVYNTLQLTIDQDSIVDDSVHQVLLPHELFSNLIAQINGGEFYSDVFGREDLGYDVDGEFAYLGITTGELLRGIPPDEVQIATSMREAFASYSSIICLGAIIDKDQIRIDPLDVLFNANISANIGEVKELNIVPAKGFLFNSVKAGYPVFEYEQENGRDEVNTEYQFTNSLQAVKKELDLVSKYYGGSYFVEFARRMSVINTGTADTKFDGKICFIDLIKVDGELISRRLEDILFVDGIFSPETAINLRIAPGQNMLRWKKYLNIPLDKKEKVYYFQSKDKNASLNLVTALGTTVDGQDLDTGGATLFKPEERQFKCPITIDLLFSILANPLGIVHYTYEGEKFFDYLFEVDAETDKGQATWRMLGTKDSPVQVIEDVAIGNYLKYGDGLQDFVKYGDGPDDFILYQ